MIKLFEHFELSKNKFITYHSTNYEIDEFNFDEYHSNPGSSTRIDGIFFSDVPQNSWGDNLYKVEITSKYPVKWDMSDTKFDSLSVQEAFDALLRGEISYIVDDLVDYQEKMGRSKAENLTSDWSDNLDLIILENCNYSKHRTEYIIPSPSYNGHSAKIRILEKL